MNTSAMTTVLDKLLSDSRSYWAPSTISETDTLPTSLSFLRENVSQSMPLVLRGAASSWTAVSHWTPGYLRAQYGEVSLSVALTPDGLADAVTNKRFAQPAFETWTLAHLLDVLGRKVRDADCVPYYSAQNSCLTDEAPELCADIDMQTIDFAREAFGKTETATNLWIGDERSVTTMHADPFENMYAVVCGQKRFELRPPCDAAVLRKPEWRDARWMRTDDGWKLEDENEMTRWIDHRVDHPGNSVLVDLFAGDILYLPPLWFHGVRQIGLTIAVNWWFDMTYGRDWVLKQLFDNLRDEAEDKAVKAVATTPER